MNTNKWVANIRQTGASTKITAKTERRAKVQASQWQSYEDRNYCMVLYYDADPTGDGPCVLEPVARKENGRWTAI